MKKNTAVVAGGGMSGLLAALLLGKKGYETALVEKEESCGGLLRSWKNTGGVWFDYGTHFLRDTGIPELDALLFEGIVKEKDWHVLPFLKAGNYFQGNLNEQNQFPDVTRLPKDVYEKGMAELLSLKEETPDASNLEEQLVGMFGKTFTARVFAPALRKLFGAELKDLASGVHTLFGLSRIAAFTPEKVQELKASFPAYDANLAFHSFTEGLSGKKSYYPKKGGIGRYAELFGEKLKTAGVRVLTSESVEHIEHHQREIQNVVLESGASLDCDILVWTVPAPLFAKAAQISFPFATDPPRLRATTLHHLVLDSPFQTDLFYLTCFDPRFSAFRVTLYPNIGEEPRRTPPYNCTVEVLSDTREDSEMEQENLREELADMGVLSPGSRLLSAESQSVGLGFPVLANAFVKQSQRQQAFLSREFKNAVFLGKINTSSFFLEDVLKETYLTLQKLD